MKYADDNVGLCFDMLLQSIILETVAQSEW